MPNMLLMLEQYFLNLIKKGEKLDKDKLSKFFGLWLDFDKFVNKIFDCL